MFIFHLVEGYSVDVENVCACVSFVPNESALFEWSAVCDWLRRPFLCVLQYSNTDVVVDKTNKQTALIGHVEENPFLSQTHVCHVLFIGNIPCALLAPFALVLNSVAHEQLLDIVEYV